ncbi:hypothetical protein MTO96_018191, partial [Rhipicephalus appendiculatus]
IFLFVFALAIGVALAGGYHRRLRLAVTKDTAAVTREAITWATEDMAESLTATDTDTEDTEAASTTDEGDTVANIMDEKATAIS